MKISHLKINGFGKLKEKEVKLYDGLNVIYGKNESGKSTILKFITSMLYGISKNKKGKDISDFEKFKPWTTENFSGKLTYMLDNQKTFEIYRDFKKKNPMIYNDKAEDISKSFVKDKTKGIDFFVQQTGIDEETFFSTAITEQEGIKLSKASQNSIIQKISNLISSGDDTISFQKTMEKINKKQNEEVGTDRTSQRPINMINIKIQSLLDKKRSLEIYKDSIYDNALQKEQLYMEQKNEETKAAFLKEIKSKLDNDRVKNVEINFSRNLEKEYDIKIKELNRKASEHLPYQYEKNKDFAVYYIALAISIILLCAMYLLYKGSVTNVIFLLPVLIILGIILHKKYFTKDIKIKANDDKEKVIQEIEILRQNKEEQRRIADEKQKKFMKEKEKEKQDYIQKYIKTLDIGYMNEQLEKNYDEILKELDKKENRIRTIQFKLQTMENETKNIHAKIESLISIEEEMSKLQEEKKEIMSLNTSFQIAKACLESAYQKVKENISPRFVNNLCDIISKISNNRYQKVVLNDKDGLLVEMENGRYIPATRLSIGTIDQMYISLRWSALNEISNETMPIILDEAFAYFDNDRLANILQYLYLNFPNHQMIIFTCSYREKELLDKLPIEYHFINLEK